MRRRRRRRSCWGRPLAEPQPTAQAQALLAQLRDIHLPESGGGAEILAASVPWAAVLGLGLLTLALLALRLWRRRHPLQLALRRLRALERRYARDGDAQALGRGLALLLRQHALRTHPGRPVAGLTGTAWLDFLDRHGGGGRFRHGPGAVLDTLPYRGQGQPVDAPALIALTARWLRANPR